MEVVPLKNVLFLAALKLNMNTREKLKAWEKLIKYKHCLACILLTQTLPMYFRVNLKMEKPTLHCSFTCIVFIELNFTVAMLQIRASQW